MAVLWAFLWRFALVVSIFCLTYNPDGISAFHWVAGGRLDLSAKLLIIAVMVALWFLIVGMAWKNIGKWGTFLVLILFGVFFFFLFNHAPAWVTGNIYGIYVLVAMFLTPALIWPKIRFKLTGARATDDQGDEN